MNVNVIIVGQLEVNCYVITQDNSSDAVIIDPGDEYERIHEVIESRSAMPKYIVFTHAHYDHVCAIGDLKSEYNPILVMHEHEGKTYQSTTELCLSWGFDKEDFPLPDLLVKDGDSLELGAISFKIIHTPGHTPGSMCLFGAGTLFTGDTLFADSVGRTDLPGGSTAKLRESLRKIATYPDGTVIRSGHGGEVTLKRCKEINLFLREL